LTAFGFRCLFAPQDFAAKRSTDFGLIWIPLFCLPFPRPTFLILVSFWVCLTTSRRGFRLFFMMIVSGSSLYTRYTYLPFLLILGGFSLVFRNRRPFYGINFFCRWSFLSVAILVSTWRYGLSHLHPPFPPVYGDPHPLSSQFDLNYGILIAFPAFPPSDVVVFNFKTVFQHVPAFLTEQELRLTH